MRGFEHIAIIGGGVGGALAHDLALRGFRVTLVEKGELLSGTTGRHHGLLHSGARYVLHDPEAARECWQENQILRRIAPQAIEPNGGLFVAVSERDFSFRERFQDECATVGIPLRPLAAQQALAMEPGLNPGLRAAVEVPDAVMDAWRLPMHFFASARSNGAAIRSFTEATAMRVSRRAIAGLDFSDHRTGRAGRMAADVVVNAAGPWAGRIAAMAGVRIPLHASPGVMVAVPGRLAHRVVHRLQPAGEGDIIVPQRRLSILGTTAWLADDPDRVSVPQEHVRRLLAMCGELLPAATALRPHVVWAASRPLLRRGETADPYRISRSFECIDHAARDGVEGLVTLIGGKATTMRAMAEAAADLICRKVGRPIGCRTRETPLQPYRDYWRQA